MRTVRRCHFSAIGIFLARCTLNSLNISVFRFAFRDKLMTGVHYINVYGYKMKQEKQKYLYRNTFYFRSGKKVI
jgi:hypothetical protein